MPIDDPAMQDALAKYNRRRPCSRRSRIADTVATALLVIVHGLFFGATMVMLAFLVMGTDPCAYQECGDQAWVNRALGLGFWAGAATFVADLVVAVVRLRRKKLAWFVPVIGWLSWRWATAPR